MPELPEVEVVTQTLKVYLKDTKIQACEFRRADLREPMPQQIIRKILKNQPISAITRRSKYIILETPKGRVFFHLGMTGKFIYRRPKDPPQKHAHVSFHVKGKGQDFFLDFDDPRRFGRIDAELGFAELTEHRFFAELGPEPLEHRRLAEHLYAVSRKRSTPIKSFVMDAHNVVGVGNIYASESLFAAGIHPLTPAKNLALADFRRLAVAIRRILKAAIKAGGTSISDFQHADGSKGYFSLSLNVYDRTNQPCKECQDPIKNLRIAGRSSFYCAICQIYKK